MASKGKASDLEFSRAQPPSTYLIDVCASEAVTRLACVSLASAAEALASQPLKAELAFPLATRVPL